MLRVSVALSLVSHSTEAQSQRSSASGYRAWLGAGIGGSGRSGVSVAWEAWVSRGALGIGYQGSATDDYSLTAHEARSLLVGANIPRGRLLGRAAVGVASARRCRWQGEQSGLKTCTSARKPEFAVSLDVLLNSYFAIHTSYFDIPSKSVGHSALLIGFVAGRIGT